MIMGCGDVCLRGENLDALLLLVHNVDPFNTIPLGTSRHVTALCVLRLPLSVNHNVEPTQYTPSIQAVYLYIFKKNGTLCDICIL